MIATQTISSKSMENQREINGNHNQSSESRHKSLEINGNHEKSTTINWNENKSMDI